MLQIPALVAWEHPEADDYRKDIDYVGVFVATDVSWGAQLKALGRSDMPTGLAATLGISAFTTHVLIAMVDAMKDCTSPEVLRLASLKHLYVELSKSNEVLLVDQISQNWRLKPLAASFHGLKLALRNRLTEIAEYAGKERYHSSYGSPLSSAQDYLHLGFLEAVIFAIEAFNELSNNPHRRWALLFDELEIAPDEIRQALFRALRSTDQRLLFKLSISPYHEDIDLLRTSISAMPGQDYQPIELWYPYKEEGYEFSEALLEAMMKDIGCEPISPDLVFGPSEFATDRDEYVDQSAYSPNSRLHRRFCALVEKDDSFKKYLLNNGVDVDRMDSLSENKRAGFVRKVASIVAVREAYRSSPQDLKGGIRVGRSRKSSSLYTGSKSLFAIVEGNPRWFIGMMSPLLQEFRESQGRVSRDKQAKAIDTASSRFRALLRTIPYAPPSGGFRRNIGVRGLLSLLDGIGQTFHENVVSNDFSAEPVLSFTVDTNTSPELLQALGRALNAGAIILVPDETGETLVSSLRGKRFRLSYMLSCYYRIPLTLGRPGSLFQILGSGQPDKPLLKWFEP
jgi:hypothetical protein